MRTKTIRSVWVIVGICSVGEAVLGAEVRAAHQGQPPIAFAQPSLPLQPQPADSPANLVFHLPFDQDCVAVKAAGDPKPREVKRVELVAGAKGKAGHFVQGATLRFGEAGNMVKERGTLMVWFKSDWSSDQTSTPDGKEIWRFLFQEGPAPEQEKRTGTNQMRLWFWGSRLRFDLSDSEERFIAREVSEWKAGEWHHIAATWDHRRDRHLYLDGCRIERRAENRKTLSPITWEPKAFDHFFIGSGPGKSTDGSIDDLKVFDQVLTDDAIRSEFATVFPVAPVAQHLYFVVGQPTRLRWTLDSWSASAMQGRLSWQLLAPSGENVAGEESVDVSLPAKGSKDFAVPFTPKAAGEHKLVCRWQPSREGLSYERRVSFWGIEPEEARTAGGELKLRLIETIDCASELPADRFVASGPTHVVRSAIGAYREAGTERHNRFAVRFRIPKVGSAYVIDWEYPDDKPRTMEIIAQTMKDPNRQYELQTGAFCGAEYPVSNRMLTQRSVFWPRGEDLALIFMTAEKDRPVAVGKIRVHEVQGRLPKLPVYEAPVINGWKRMVGLYYEDTSLCFDFGGFDSMPDFKLTVDRLMDYMDWFGQNLFMYPAVWYHGPLYPSRSQGEVMIKPHPTGFIEYMLLRFGQRGISFIPTLAPFGLPSLGDVKWDEGMRQTGDAAKGPLMVYADGTVNLEGWNPTPPDFNPLHPDVQNAFLKIVDEMLDLYAEHPAFKGICVRLSVHKILWFGSLEAGYNDYCVEAFEAETKTKIPVDANDPARAKKRYDWLMANAREPWIRWRCRKLHAFYEQIADKLRQRRPDLKLVVELCQPSPKTDESEFEKQFGKTNDFLGGVNRVGGIDVSLYRNSRNIVVERTVYPADYRWTRSRKPGEDPTELRHRVLDDRFYAPVRQAGECWINLHDRYWEDAVGRETKWDGFWGEEQGWRVSTLNPNQDHCMESYAVPLANMDSLVFSKGGFLVGTIGMESQVGRFTQAFRALPAQRFNDVPGASGPVKVRSLPHPQGLYLYLVNPTPKPEEIGVRFDGVVTSIYDYLSNKTEPLGFGARRFKVAPYALQPYFVRGSRFTATAVR